MTQKQKHGPNKILNFYQDDFVILSHQRGAVDWFVLENEVDPEKYLTYYMGKCIRFVIDRCYQ